MQVLQKKRPYATGGRGQKTSVPQRQKLLGLTTRAYANKARLNPAHRQIGLSYRCVQSWQRAEAAEGDQRPSGKRRHARPTNKAALG